MLPPSDQPDRRSPEARLRAWWSATARGSTPGEVDVAAATTITGFVGLLVAALQAVLLVLHPPTDGIGPAGWVLAGLAITAGATASWSLVDRGVEQLLGEPGSPGGSPASRARLDPPAKGSAEAETPRPGR